MKADINISPEHFAELLILCGHDTHHDFFENRDPFKNQLSQGGGSYWDDPYEEGATRSGRYYMFTEEYNVLRLIQDMKLDELIEYIDDDYNIYTAVNEDYINIVNNIINGQINAVYSDPLESDPNSFAFLKDVKVDPEMQRIIDSNLAGTYKDLSPPREGVARDRRAGQYSRRNTVKSNIDMGSGQLNRAKKVDAQRKEMRATKIQQKRHAVKKGGALPEVTFNFNQAPGRLASKMKKIKLLLKIFEKIKIWDGQIYLMNYIDYYYPNKQDGAPPLGGALLPIIDRDQMRLYKNLSIFNSLMPLQPSDKLYNFHEWINNVNVTSYFLKKINETVIQAGGLRREYHLVFHLLVEKYIEKIPITEIEFIFDDLKKFTAYTSINDINDVNIEPTNVSINLDTFIKKKWKTKYKPQDPNTEPGKLYSDIFETDKKSIILSKAQLENIDILKNSIMNFWVEFSGLTANPPSSKDWLKNQIDKMTGSGIGTINDKSLREEFLDEEFSIENTSTQGFHRWKITADQPNMTEKRNSMRDHDIETELLKVSQEAFNHGSFGNNASSTKLYSQGPNGKWKRLNKPNSDNFLKGPIMDNKIHYNCNIPNVADPASTCPKCDSKPPCNNQTIVINLRVQDDSNPSMVDVIVPPGVQPGEMMQVNVGGQLIPVQVPAGVAVGETFQVPVPIPPARGINLKMTAKSNDLANGSKIEYSIHGLGGGVLSAEEDINKKPPGGKKVECLSKTYVLNKVFETIRGSSGGGNFSETLSNFAEQPPNLDQIKNIVQVFCLKLFGDFGQELYAIAKSNEQKKTVYIGNDWISYIRYLFLKKYTIPKSPVDWWAGFLGNTSFNIIYNIRGQPSPAVSPVTRGGGKKKSRKKTKRKSRKKVKKTKRKSRKKTKRKSRKKTK